MFLYNNILLFINDILLVLYPIKSFLLIKLIVLSLNKKSDFLIIYSKYSISILEAIFLIILEVFIILLYVFKSIFFDKISELSKVNIAIVISV
ncbi:hypothetical protein AMV239 [Betaentomopoxvirus amoorei]|uniref:AMV239 n=1 Tax=Amsacta moorei entomopoxvirus TaxID=28321 RepID=Q9EMG7_AMEPV|nr:hypothetical protein AMV239 [Amsacta moorei entomopoxvirus]AAG02945.1 AMV239 [Amsacta moorei entomopoxvirus]